MHRCVFLVIITKRFVETNEKLSNRGAFLFYYETISNALVRLFSFDKTSITRKLRMNRLKSEGYFLEKPPKGIAFSFPLNVLEEIFDFSNSTLSNKESFINYWERKKEKA